MGNTKNVKQIQSSYRLTTVYEFEVSKVNKKCKLHFVPNHFGYRLQKVPCEVVEIIPAQDTQNALQILL